MTDTMKRWKGAVETAVSRGLTLSRGRVAGSEFGGRLMVRAHALEGKTIACDVLVPKGSYEGTFAEGEEVLLALDPDEARTGIVLGRIDPAPAIRSGLAEASETVEAPHEEGIPENTTVVASRRIVVKAGEELVLECGGGIVRITKDGKIVIRGERILSRASGAHRIKGGSVDIN